MSEPSPTKSDVTGSDLNSPTRDPYADESFEGQSPEKGKDTTTQSGNQGKTTTNESGNATVNETGVEKVTNAEGACVGYSLRIENYASVSNAQEEVIRSFPCAVAQVKRIRFKLKWHDDTELSSKVRTARLFYAATPLGEFAEKVERGMEGILDLEEQPQGDPNAGMSVLRVVIGGEGHRVVISSMTMFLCLDSEATDVEKHFSQLSRSTATSPTNEAETEAKGDAPQESTKPVEEKQIVQKPEEKPVEEKKPEEKKPEEKKPEEKKPEEKKPEEKKPEEKKPEEKQEEKKSSTAAQESKTDPKDDRVSPSPPQKAKASNAQSTSNRSEDAPRDSSKTPTQKAQKRPSSGSHTSPKRSPVRLPAVTLVTYPSRQQGLEVADFLDPSRPLVKSTLPTTKPKGPSFVEEGNLQDRNTRRSESKLLNQVLTDKISSQRENERKYLKAQYEFEREKALAERAVVHRESVHRWTSKLSASPLAVDLVADIERIEDLQSNREREEQRRRMITERKKKRIKNEIIVKALAEVPLLEEARRQKRELLEEERREKALRDVQRVEAVQTRKQRDYVDMEKDRKSKLDNRLMRS